MHYSLRIMAIEKHLMSNHRIKGMPIERPFQFIQLHGQPSSLAEFYTFCQKLQTAVYKLTIFIR